MRNTNTKILLLRTALVVTVIAMLLWFTNKNRTITVDSGFRMTMGTIARIMVVAENQQQAHRAINAAVDEIYHIEELMSDYDPNSQLSKVNRQAFARPVSVDAELFEVLTTAKLYSCLSDGAFDITIGPVVQLWQKAKKDNTAPTADALRKAKECVGYKNLILNTEKQTVQFAKDGMLLDLGGIAKGYAIDKAIEILQNTGMKGAMVDIGGDLHCFGTPANGAEHWLIGLQDPTNEENILLTLNMDDRAVATSGDYRRFVIIDDQKHSHIINPATADSAGNLSSVTLIAPTALAADALATAVTVLDNKKGLALINQIETAEAILIQSDKSEQFTKSSNADQYIQKRRKR